MIEGCDWANNEHAMADKLELAASLFQSNTLWIRRQAMPSQYK